MKPWAQSVYQSINQCFVGTCVCAEDDASLSLYLSGDESDVVIATTDSATSLTGRYTCRVSACLFKCRDQRQLARHYTELHVCDFSPPRDEEDLEIYNRCMPSFPHQPSTSGNASSRKRKRWSPKKQRGKSPKRARVKAG